MSASRHLVDPELLDLLDSVPPLVLNPENLAEVRADRHFPLEVELTPEAAAVKLSRHLVKGPQGAPDVPLLVYQPQHVSKPVGCIFHIHGGGYVLGQADRSEPLHRKMVATLGCVLATVDYRLAPETCFPGNIEDCYAALSWLFGRATELKVDLRRVGVMGESAGGGFAAALALLARDRGEFKLAFQHLIYPMIDDRTCVDRDPHPVVGEFIWNPTHNHFGWSSLLGAAPGSKNVSPYAAAARAENLAGLPPTFLSTATLDLFLEENLEYARRLMRAAVPVELHVYPGAYHGFDLHPTAAVARAAQRDSMAALARFLGARAA